MLFADYVGFIKKVMKQLQVPQYMKIKRIDVDMSQLDEVEAQNPNDEGLIKTGFKSLMSDDNDVIRSCAACAKLLLIII